MEQSIAKRMNDGNGSYSRRSVSKAYSGTLHTPLANIRTLYDFAFITARAKLDMETLHQRYRTKYACWTNLKMEGKRHMHMKRENEREKKKQQPNILTKRLNTRTRNLFKKKLGIAWKKSHCENCKCTMDIRTQNFA